MENNENLKNLISKFNKELGKQLDNAKNIYGADKLYKSGDKIISDINKHTTDYIKDAFDKMSDKDKNDVVNAINAVSDYMDNWFGTNTKKWTVDDFKKESMTDSDSKEETKEPVEENSEKETVKDDGTEEETVQGTKLNLDSETGNFKPFKRTIEITDESDDADGPSETDKAFPDKEDTYEQTEIPSWQDICNCPGAFYEYEDEDDVRLNDDGTVTFKHEWWKHDNTDDEHEDDKKVTIDESKPAYPLCHESPDMYDCYECRYNDICDKANSEDTDEGEEEGETICEMLLQELKEFNTPEEEISLKVVNYVVDQLLDKTAHNYTLHPRTIYSAPSVEVTIPYSMLTPDTLDKSSILEELICEELAYRVGTETAELKTMDGCYIAYIPLE